MIIDKNSDQEYQALLSEIKTDALILVQMYANHQQDNITSDTVRSLVKKLGDLRTKASKNQQHEIRRVRNHLARCIKHYNEKNYGTFYDKLEEILISIQSWQQT